MTEGVRWRERTGLAISSRSKMIYLQAWEVHCTVEEVVTLVG